MSREWKPGDVVKVCNEIAMRVATGEISAGPAFIFASGDEWQNATARPLVVIDPEDREQVERLFNLIADAEDATLDKRINSDEWALGAVQAALREFANPTPPKPEEPTGMGAVVKDCDGNVWVLTPRRVGFGDDRKPWWFSDHGSSTPHWHAIDAVKVLSEGVTP